MMTEVRSGWLCIYPSEYKNTVISDVACRGSLFSSRSNGVKSFKWFKCDNLGLILLIVSCLSYARSENVYEGYSPLCKQTSDITWLHLFFYGLNSADLVFWCEVGMRSFVFAMESTAFLLWFLSLQSVGFTGASGFTLAAVWLVSFGVALVVHHCVTWRINIKWKGAKHSQKICPIVLILFTCAST